MDRFKFRKTDLEALPLPETGKRANYYDTEVPKLALRVTHAGAKVFYVVKRADSGMAWIKLGAFPDMTVENARKEAQKVLAEFASGANPATARRALREEATVGDLLEDFLANKRKRDGAPLAERTRMEYRNLARLYLTSIMKMKLSVVTQETVSRMHRKIGESAPFSANRAKALVSSIFSHAKDTRQFTGDNPADGVKGYAETARDRFAQAFELPRLMEAIGQSPLRDFFLLSLLTGARRSNMQAMAWRDVDLAGAVWRISKTKNGTPQNVPLSAEAVAVLTARKESTDSPWVFPGTGATGHLVEPKKAWATVLRSASLARLLDAMQAAGKINDTERTEADTLTLAGLAKAEKRYQAEAAKAGINPADHDLTDLRIHDLRRTLGSWQARTGASMIIIGKSLNHKSHQSTAIYTRLDLDPVRQSVNTATAAMLEAAGLKDGADVVKLPKRGAI